MCGTGIKKKWEIRTPSFPYSDDAERERIITEISADFNIPRICASIIADRGFRTRESAHSFIYNNYIADRDPFALADMDWAAERILRAIESRTERVVIFGDYDVDGVTSASLLYLYLAGRGVHCGYYIPKRSDGYGMSREAIDTFAREGVTLIITVDTGITACDEIEYAASVGIDTVVTDHHECRPELPRAVAVVNPHRPDCSYPWKELAGVGVAYKLICALEILRARSAGKSEYEAERSVLLKYADLVAIGTIADVMPLIDENRMIVSYGLRIMSHSKRKGIEALIRASSRQPEDRMSASYISFTIAPRLNAAGRMDNASLAAELLLSESDATAQAIAEKLCEINQQRQIEENRIAGEAERMIDSDPSYLDDRFLLLGSDGWSHGVIGIVASRLTEKYGKPAILVTFDNSFEPGLSSGSDIGKGSGRSVRGVNLFDALASCEELLERFGGHEQAAGLSVKRANLPLLREKLNEYMATHLPDGEPSITLFADAEIEPEMINVGFSDELSQLLEPCGTGNPQPVFIMKDVLIRSVRAISSGRHCKLTVEKNGFVFQALYYGKSISEIGFNDGDIADLLFSVSTNRYRGEVSAQLVISDMRFATSFYRERLSQIERLGGILLGSRDCIDGDVIPGREDFVAFFGILSDFLRSGRSSFTDNYMVSRLARLRQTSGVGFIKYKLMLKVFGETGVFDITEEPIVTPAASSEWNLPDDLITLRKIVHRQKIDLDSSSTMKMLKAIPHNSTHAS